MTTTGWPARVGPWILVAVASLGFETMLLVHPWDQTTLTVVDDLLLAVAGLVAAVACQRRSRREAGRHRRGWRLLAAGCATFSLGQVGFALQAALVFGTTDVGGTPADVFNILSIPLAVGGLVSLAGSSMTSRFVTTLDACTVAFSSLYVSWIVFLEPVYRTSTDRTERVTTLFYVGGSLALATLVLIIASRWRGDGLTLILLGAAFVWLSVANAAYGLASVRDTYVTGNVRIDLGWFAPFLLIALAAARPGGRSRTNDLRARWLLTLFVPYLAIVLVVVMTFTLVVRGDRFDAFLQLCGVSILTLVLARQVLTLLDIHALQLDLERRVEERSAAVRRSEARLGTLLRNSSDVIALVDEEGVLRYASPATAVVLGLRPEEVIGRPVLDLVHPGERSAAEQVLRAASASGLGTASLACRLARGNGHWRHVEAMVSALHDDPVHQGLVLNIRDVSERVALQAEMKHQASYDPLTSLANRRLFHERVRHALDRVSRTDEAISVLYIDLDHFKRVNDTAGHTVGDQVLVQVAERLLAVLRPADTAARLGGDEFGVLLEGTGAADAQEVAAHVLAALAPVYSLPDHRTLTLTASLGVTSCTGGHGSSEALLRDADVAMYQAKAHGRAQFATFHPGMHTRLIEQMKLETGLRQALSRDELNLVYQPLIDLGTGEVTGVEALLRWSCGPEGEVPPALFIALAEDRGLIQEIDRWVLRRACRQVRDWQLRFPRHSALRANVNLSALELHEPLLLEQLSLVLEETGLAPEHLVLEITETAVLPDTDEVSDILQRVQGLGVGVSLDDFGTGYSSLTTLQRFPLDEIKIDGSFVDAIASGAKGRDLVSAIIAMAEALDLRTVAEAVETPDQLACLQRLHCGAAQGFLFSPPLPPEGMERLFAQGLSALEAVAWPSA